MRLLFLLLFLAIVTASSFGQDFPERALIGYWHNWTGSNGIPLAQVPAEYDVVNVSFAIPTTPAGAVMSFAPDPGLYPNPADFAQDLQMLQARGTKVQISIGGAAHPVHVDSPAAASAFATSMAAIVAAWGFDGLDIDLEGSSLSLVAGDLDFANPTSPRIVHFIAGVQQLLGLLPPSFSLTAAPETAFVQGGYAAYGGIWGAYLPVLHALRNELDLVHVQHYNTGSMFGRDGNIYSPGTPDFHVAMADMLVSGFTVFGGNFFPPLGASKVAIGLPASSSAAGSGFTAAPLVHDALDYLFLGRSFGGNYVLAQAAGHLDFGGLMTWSVNWDLGAGQSFSVPHRRYLDRLELDTDSDFVSTTTGGGLQLDLSGGAGNAGRTYFLVPGLSGTSPGVGLQGGLVLPVNPDTLTAIAFGPGGGNYFSGLVGVLDAQGEATATLSIPPMPGVSELLHFAWFLPFPATDFVSDAVGVTFAP
jgi:chitinase